MNRCNTSAAVPTIRLALVPDVALSGPFSYNARVAWSPDSDCVALFDPGDWIHIDPQSSSVALLDASTGKQRTVHRGHHRIPKALGWHPLGKLIVSGGVDQNLHVWYAETGLCRENASVFYGHWYWISSVACDPTGTYVASGDVEGTIHLVDLDCWDVYWTPQLGGWKRVTALAFSPDGHYLLSASQEGHGKTTVALWNVTRRKWERNWEFQQTSVRAFARSSDLLSVVVIGESTDTAIRRVDLIQIDGNDLLTLRGVISAAWIDQGDQLRVITSDGEVKDYHWTDLIDFDTYALSNALWLRRFGGLARGLVEHATSSSSDFQRLFPETAVPRSRITPFFSPTASRIAFVERGQVSFCTVHVYPHAATV